jgi:hypothetical protein
MNSRYFYLLIIVLFSSLPPAWSAGVTVVGELTRMATVKPGEKTEGRIVLVNTADTSREVKVYLTDYRFYADGRNFYDEPGTQLRSNANWVTFAPNQFTMAPGSTASIYYTINIPERVTLPGSHWSMLMVEPYSAEQLQPPQPDEQGQVGIRTITRYGIQLITNIGVNPTRSITFLDKQLLAQDGARVLLVDIEDNGETVLTPLVWAELYDAQGVSLGRFEAGRMRLLPGCSARFRIDLTQVPAGKYTALIVADNGDDSVFGAKCLLDISQ